MKKVILLLTLLPGLAYGQIFDNFESGTLSGWEQFGGSRWKADTSGAISGSYSLHHVYDNTDAGLDQAGMNTDSLQPSEGTATWSFTVRHGYDPSSSNNWAVLILSDTGPSTLFTEGKTHGYAVGVNLTGYDDTLRLWKINGSVITPVLSTGFNWQSEAGPGSAVRITVERQVNGNWDASLRDLSEKLLATGNGNDPQLFDCSWLVVLYRYTSTRDRLLWFDDLAVTGVFHADTPPADTARAGPGDLVISEIMADPEPVVSLPAAEYLELTNRTATAFGLDGWILNGGGTDYPFPACTIGPGEYLILCPAKDTSALSPFGRVAGFRQFPALTDAGKLLLVYDNNGRLIHGTDYSSDWYNDELRSEGGWSLEMIDCAFPFTGRTNWRASLSGKGGTPGQPNSVKGENPDLSFDGRITFFATDSTHVSVYSPEPLFTFLAGIDSMSVDGMKPLSVSQAEPLMRSFVLEPAKPLKRKMISEAVITACLKDFAGNRPVSNSYRFGLAEPPDPGDIRFNELLFNPLPGDPDYIELYNLSSKIIDASRLELVSVNGTDTSSIYRLSEIPLCILPGDYFAVTANRLRVTERYPCSSPDYITEVAALPSMPDDKGHLLLYSRELTLLDELSYDEDMHSALIPGSEGIALEKTDPLASSAIGSGWRSASESCGWGTPGAKNTAYNEDPASTEPVSLSCTRISPDDDGNDDFLVLHFNMGGTGSVITVKIFDENGYCIRKVAENFWAGTEASLVWDGKDDNGSMTATGIYIVFVSSFDEKGKVHHWKKVCTLVR